MNFIWLAYAAALLAIWLLYYIIRKRRERVSKRIRDAAIESGLTEPASLHPVINPALCFGCGACVSACPEGYTLGLIDGKAQLIEPTQCIGHGACKTSCPNDAISLVFGTEKRGVDIPHVGPDFQTNVPGIYIAGELGGMGLIGNAIEQGCQAVESILRRSRARAPDRLDLVIVGAGPAGFAASLAALEHKLNFITVEQDTLGGTVSHFPRGKLVMTRPAALPIIGRMNFKEISKEELIAFWQEAERKSGLKINYEERVDTIDATGYGFEVRTTRGAHRSGSVLLAIGRRGTPRTLGVPGEDLPKVVYRLIDPTQYQGRHVLVVGGGDSALEAATSIADEPGSTVTLSYRGDSFSRAKLKNRQKVESAQRRNGLNVLLGSNVKRISECEVEIEQDGKRIVEKNDAVIVCAGGILPMGFLKSMGIDVETKHGTA